MTVLIVSSCGYSLANRGDQAMLRGLLSWLAQNIPNVKPVILANNPAELDGQVPAQVVQSPENAYCALVQRLDRSIAPGRWMRQKAWTVSLWLYLNSLLFRHTGRTFIRDQATRDFFVRLRVAKAFILAGGGYLNSLWWLDGLFAKASAALCAKASRVPIILTSQGVGPLTHPLDRWMVKLVGRVGTVLGVRDGDHSARLLSRNYAHESRLLLTGDDALLLSRIPPEVSVRIIEDAGIPRATPLIGVNLRDSSSYQAGYPAPKLDILAGAVDGLVDALGGHAVFVPISYNNADDDRTSANAVFERMKKRASATVLREAYSPDEIRAITAEMSVVIGTSYHFLLFALSAGVPALGVYQNDYYKQKLDGLFSLYGVPEYAIDLRNDASHRLDEATNRLLANRVSILQTLRSAAARIDEQAECSRKIIRGHLSRSVTGALA